MLSIGWFIALSLFRLIWEASFENSASWTVTSLALYQIDLMYLSYLPLPNSEGSSTPSEEFPVFIDTSHRTISQAANAPDNLGRDNGTNGGPDLSIWTQLPTATLDPTIYESGPIPKGHLGYPRPRCIGKIADHPSANRDYAQDKIDKYCKQTGTGNGSPQGGVIVEAKAPYAPIGYAVKDDQAKDDDSTLWLSTALILAASCEKGFMIDQTACEAVFGQILDGCNTDSADKFGGTVVYGCGVYDMQTTVGMGQTPPRGEIQEMVDFWAARGTTTFF